MASKAAGTKQGTVAEVKNDISRLLPDLQKAQNQYWDIQKDLGEENDRFKELLEHYDSLKTAAILIREESSTTNDSLFYGPLTESEVTRDRFRLKLKDTPNNGQDALTLQRNQRFIIQRLLQSYTCKNDIFSNLNERQKLKYLKLSDRYERIEAQIISQAEIQKDIEELLIKIQAAVRRIRNVPNLRILTL